MLLQDRVDLGEKVLEELPDVGVDLGYAYREVAPVAFIPIDIFSFCPYLVGAFSVPGVININCFT